jgi:LacI family transcriptional regulator, galactose operon repressor
MREIPKVALLVETSRGFGRDLLRGIARYARLHGPWSFHITPGDYAQEVPKMKQWGGTGIIARIANERIAQAVADADVPTVTLGPAAEHAQFASLFANFSEVSSDPVQVATLAAEHLLERQFSHFAYVGLEDRAWSHMRCAAFAARLAEAGHELHEYRQPTRPRDRVWEREQNLLAEWIQHLPTPIGLLACNDDRGRQVLEACRLANLNVPEDVAVLGIDNDEVFCDLSDPPLSSVALNAETAGYRAAELLDGLMSGRVRKRQRILVEAIGVVTRRSTEVVAVSDPDVVAALQYIRREQGRGISVLSVANEVAVSRRSLEKRFRETIGRTILEEIQLVRLERAKRLLLETTYPISRIAEMSGFGSTGYFIQFFQSRAGETPRKFRIKLTT